MDIGTILYSCGTLWLALTGVVVGARLFTAYAGKRDLPPLGRFLWTSVLAGLAGLILALVADRLAFAASDGTQFVVTFLLLLLVADHIYGAVRQARAAPVAVAVATRSAVIRQCAKDGTPPRVNGTSVPRQEERG